MSKQTENGNKPQAATPSAEEQRLARCQNPYEDMLSKMAKQPQSKLNAQLADIGRDAKKSGISVEDQIERAFLKRGDEAFRQPKTFVEKTAPKPPTEHGRS